MSEQTAFIIEGLEGGRELAGTVQISGAKNAALKALAASLLFEGEVVLENVPVIEDVKRIAELIEDIGVPVAKSASGSRYTIVVPEQLSTDLNPAISKRIRASVVLTGPILAREGEVTFPHPGGCLIGERPIDLFLEGFERMGARVETDGETYRVSVPKGKKLRGTVHFLRTPSVTVTETLMMAALLAEGETIIKNAALEPEIAHLARYLNLCGAKIRGIDTTTLVIQGRAGSRLRAGRNIYTTIPDRIEAGSYLILAALAGRDVTINHCNPEHVEALTETLRRSGVELEVGKDYIRVPPTHRTVPYRSVSIKTLGYPGFPTDLQAIMTVFLTQAEGEALVHETIWEGRFGYVEPLKSMGANIAVMDPHRILVRGPRPLHRKRLESPDMRAGLAFIIAAIVARGTSTIQNTYLIERGYEHVEEKLSSIGVKIKRM